MQKRHPRRFIDKRSSGETPLLQCDSAILKQSRRDDSKYRTTVFANTSAGRAPLPPTARRPDAFPSAERKHPLLRAVIQRVSRASVTIDDACVGRIGAGFLLLLGVTDSDGEKDADYLTRKILGLRVFEDANGKMNRSVEDIGGELLVVSQFTLYADCRKGRRPSFVRAAAPEKAERLYEYFIERLRTSGLRCETGQFGAMMNVELVNHGPVTILIDSEQTF